MSPKGARWNTIQLCASLWGQFEENLRQCKAVFVYVRFLKKWIEVITPSY